MPNSPATLFLSAAVLISGLVSCAPEKKTKDIYDPPAPRLIQTDASVPLTSWSRTSQRRLDLHDTIDFNASAPAAAEIKAACRRDGVLFSSSRRFPSPRELKLIQILPEEVLTVDLATKAADCDLEVRLFNEVGSRHILTLTALSVGDTGRAEALIEADGERPRLRPGRMEGVRLRYGNRDTAAARPLCGDVTFKALPFEQVLDAAHFDFTTPEKRPNQWHETSAPQPVQLCRFGIFEGGGLRAVTPLFELTLPAQPLEMHLSQPFATWARADFSPRAQALDHLARLPVRLAEYSLGNPGNQPRYLRVPKAAMAAHLRIVARGTLGDYNLEERRYEFDALKTYFVFNETDIFKKEADAVVLILPPGKTVSLAVDLAPIALDCSSASRKGPAIAVLEATPETPQVLEVDANLAPIETLDLPAPRPDFLTNIPRLDPQNYQLESIQQGFNCRLR